MANILLSFGEKHGLAPSDTAGRLWVNQLQLAISDVMSETYDGHHPVTSGSFYEEQAGARAHFGLAPFLDVVLTTLRARLACLLVG